MESDLERFRVRDRVTIQRILSDLARHNRPITIYFNAGQDFILSAVVGYDPKTAVVYLDCSTDETANQRLLHAQQRIAVTTHNQVPIRFSIAHLAMAEQQDYPAFAVPEPDALIRVQRREFFRIATPVANPLICRFRAADGATCEVTVVDISLSGMGLIVPEDTPQPMLAIGQQIPVCHIELPGQGSLETGFEVRNRYAHSARPGKLQIGCRFLRLDARMAARLQRFILKLDVEKRRRMPETP